MAVAQYKTQSSRVQVALRRRGCKSSNAIRTEAAFHRRAAAAGLAPAIVEEDIERSRLVMELLPGGTLKDVVERQNGRLTLTQQRRLVYLMKQLGAPTASGGAAVLHNDLGNPCNFLCDSEGTLFVIDFGLAKEIATATKAPLELPSDCATDANLLAIRHLLWDVQQGLVHHHILTEIPTVLVSAYQDLVRRLITGRSPSAMEATLITVAPTATMAEPSCEPSVSPTRGLLRRGSRRTSASPTPCPTRARARTASAAGGGLGDATEHATASASPIAQEVVEAGEWSGGDDMCAPGYLWGRDALEDEPHGAPPHASPLAPAPGSRGLRHTGRCGCTAGLALVWLLSLGSTAVAIARSPRGLNGTLPHWPAEMRRAFNLFDAPIASDERE